jgi:hypothetical protein
MADNTTTQPSRDRQFDRNVESERSRQDNRQNTSGNEMESDNSTERGRGRKERISTMVPDNYERDSE